jgi:very-short-patch-repair endonuclease
MDSFIVDFVCLEKQLITELDGGQHQENQEYDQQRTDCLAKAGFQVLRFWNDEVLQQTHVVLESILHYLQKD